VPVSQDLTTFVVPDKPAGLLHHWAKMKRQHNFIQSRAALNTAALAKLCKEHH
jgi:hypothetical protein